MSLDGILQGQECFKSVQYILNDKELKLKSYPEFDAICYPLHNLNELEQMGIDFLPHGIEEGKHIWDFRYNRAGWNIEKINNKFNYFTALFANKPKNSIREKLEKVWVIKETYKKSCIIPFEFSARIYTSLYCDEKNVKSLALTQDKKLYQIIEAMWEKKENSKSWHKEIIKSLIVLDELLYEYGSVRLIDWLKKDPVIEWHDRKTWHKSTQVSFMPLIYSLNPPISPKIDPFDDATFVNEIQFNPLDRFVHALRILEKLSPRNIINLGLNGIKKEISNDFENFSFRKSLQKEQILAQSDLNRVSTGSLVSLLSLRGNLAFCDTCHWGYPISFFKYNLLKQFNQLSLSVLIYRNNSSEYFIKGNKDRIGKNFIANMYFSSLGDNIIKGKYECPFKGSNYEVKCEECIFKFAKKYCKNSGMIKN